MVGLVGINGYELTGHIAWQAEKADHGAVSMRFGVEFDPTIGADVDPSHTEKPQIDQHVNLSRTQVILLR